MTRITQVIPMENHCLEVWLDGGDRVHVSFERRLHTIRFAMLADPDFFRRASSNGLCISWEGRVEVSVTEMLQMANE